MVNGPKFSKREIPFVGTPSYYSSSFFTLSSRFIRIDALAAHE